jgi:hypothetical protein
VQAHLVFFLARADTGKRTLDDERGELLAVNLREDDEEIGKAAVADPHLLAAERPASIRKLRRSRLRRQGVRSRPRFAQRIGTDQFSGHQTRKILLLLLRRAEQHQRQNAQIGLAAERRRKRGGWSDLFDDRER